jgi:Ca-activated chloride channel homolog
VRQQRSPSRVVITTLAVVTAAGLVMVRAQEPTTFRAGVDLVSLSVTATNAQGQYVTGLTEEDFLVLEDGLPQDLVFFSPAEAKLAISLLIDSSGSMSDRMALTRRAASRFIGQLRPGDIAQVIDFNTRVHVLQGFTDDPQALNEALESMAAGGLTSLYNAIYIALRTFDSRPDAIDKTRRHVVVVLSDGEDTSSLITYESVLDAARRSQSVIFTIGLALDPALGQSQGQAQGRLFAENPRFILRQLADQTGGRLLLTDRADDLEMIYDAIADELAHQYVLGYQPRPADGNGDEWRTIGVRVNQPNVQARTRPGYFAGSGLRLAAR